MQVITLNSGSHELSLSNIMKRAMSSMLVLCDTHDTSTRYIVAVQNTVKRHKYRGYRRELATHCTVFYNLYLPVLG